MRRKAAGSLPRRGGPGAKTASRIVIEESVSAPGEQLPNSQAPALRIGQGSVEPSASMGQQFGSLGNHFTSGADATRRRSVSAMARIDAKL